MHALGRYGVTNTPVPFIPNTMYGEHMPELYELISQFDLVVLQRCYKYEMARPIRDICDLLGKKMVFETDDDYFHIPPDNPAYSLIMKPEILTGYAEVLRMADMVTVSTPELREVVYPFNKNVHVFPNNVEYIPCGDFMSPKRDLAREEKNEFGKVKILSQFGMVAVPGYWEPVKHDRILNKTITEKKRTVRIGYTATPSHREDYKTIVHAFEKIIDKYEGKIWVVFIGDSFPYDVTMKARKRIVHIPVNFNTEGTYLGYPENPEGRVGGAHIPITYNHHMYIDHIRNIDIGLAPLVPNLFNTSKSPIKAVEYGMWGIPSVLPNMVTYAREFEHNKNCLMYNNSKEFTEALELLINDEQARNTLGIAARNHVRDFRMEYDPKNTGPRWEAYKSLFQGENFKPHKPNKVKELVNET
jgi:glycosyltransferase involved in cell wall biosynthesis